jgi:hypothetical protein
LPQARAFALAPGVESGAWPTRKSRGTRRDRRPAYREALAAASGARARAEREQGRVEASRVDFDPAGLERHPVPRHGHRALERFRHLGERGTQVHARLLLVSIRPQQARQRGCARPCAGHGREEKQGFELGRQAGDSRAVHADRGGTEQLEFDGRQRVFLDFIAGYRPAPPQASPAAGGDSRSIHGPLPSIRSMSRILYAWEVGDHNGHVVPYLPLLQALRARGTR